MPSSQFALALADAVIRCRMICARTANLLAAFCSLVSVLSAGERKLVIGMEATYPPFEAVNAQGEFTRVCVDLGREAEFRKINFDGLITALKTGRHRVEP